jgi:hypothetical protein
LGWVWRSRSIVEEGTHIPFGGRKADGLGQYAHRLVALFVPVERLGQQEPQSERPALALGALGGVEFLAQRRDHLRGMATGNRPARLRHVVGLDHIGAH